MASIRKRSARLTENFRLRIGPLTKYAHHHRVVIAAFNSSITWTEKNTGSEAVVIRLQRIHFKQENHCSLNLFRSRDRGRPKLRLGRSSFIMERRSNRAVSLHLEETNFNGGGRRRLSFVECVPLVRLESNPEEAAQLPTQIRHGRSA